jgi:hypothetical protein
MTDVVVHQPAPLVEATPDPYVGVDSWAGMLTQVAELARGIAGTDFVPDSMRGKPAAVTAAILSGRELGVGPMTALQHIHIVKGKPGQSAQLMRSLILSAGHQLRYLETTDTRCVVEGRRRGEEEWTRVAFTADQAKRARIDLGAYPEDKLVARATSRLARRLFADVIGGLAYTLEELEDLDGQPSAPLDVEAGEKPKRRTARRAAPATTTVERVDAPAAPEPVHDEPPLDDEPAPRADTVTPLQLTKIAAQMGDLGITDRDDALAYVADVIGRPIETRNDLTAAEASRLIDHMALALGEIPPTEEADRA